MQTTVNVLSYNVWLLSIELPIVGQVAGGEAVYERIEPLAKVLGPKLENLEYDVVILQEAFKDAEFLTALRAHCPTLQHNGPIPASEAPGAAGVFKCLNGGVIIVSKHTIADRAHEAFRDAEEEDQFGAKGVVYAEIELDPSATVPNVHVFGTHLQADEEYAATRSKQLRQMREFIVKIMSKKKPDEPVIMAGDFNIDRDGAQYREMKSVLRAWHGRVTGRPTIDPENDWHKKEGMTKAEYLDYVMLPYETLYKQPALVGRHEAVRFRAEVEGYGITDLSDHYAVGAQFIFQPKLPEETEMTELRFVLAKGEEKEVARLSNRRVVQFWVHNKGPGKVQMTVKKMGGGQENRELSSQGVCFLEVGQALSLRAIDDNATGEFGVGVHPLEPHIE